MPDSTSSTTPRSAEHSVRADLTRSLATQEGPYFGEFGGRFVPEALIAALDELEAEYRKAVVDPTFQEELARQGADVVLVGEALVKGGDPAGAVAGLVAAGARAEAR